MSDNSEETKRKYFTLYLEFALIEFENSEVWDERSRLEFYFKAFSKVVDHILEDNKEESPDKV